MLVSLRVSPDQFIRRGVCGMCPVPDMGCDPRMNKGKRVREMVYRENTCLASIKA